VHPGRTSSLYCESACVRRALNCEYRFYTALEILQCKEGWNMVWYTPVYHVLEAFGGNFKTVGPGASVEKQHVPHFPDDVVETLPSLIVKSSDQE